MDLSPWTERPLLYGAVLAGSFGYAWLGMRAKARTRRALGTEPAPMEPRHYVQVGAIILLVLAVSSAVASYREALKKEMLRAQFALPDDVALVDFRFVQRRKRHDTFDVAATYRFTEAQFAAYRAALDDPVRWAPKPFRFALEDMDAVYTPAARRWHPLPEPMTASDVWWETIDEMPLIHPVWWNREASAPANGRMMCFVVTKLPGGDASGYRASHCAEVTRSAWHRATVVALLDFDARTLSVTID